jgi:hypothetical protein
MCARLYKIFRKWTKKMSKNRYGETLLCKTARALGKLRNFFGDIFMRSYMVLNNLI